MIDKVEAEEEASHDDEEEKIVTEMVYYANLDSLYSLLVQGRRPYLTIEGPLKPELKGFAFPKNEHTLAVEGFGSLLFCSAALITCFNVSELDNILRFSYMRIDPHLGTHGQFHEIEVAEMLKCEDLDFKPNNKATMIHFLSDKLCILGFETTSTDQIDLQRGVCRRLCLLAFGWNSQSDKMGLVASAVIEIRGTFLAELPSNIVGHQAATWSFPLVYFKSRKRVFSLFLPSNGVVSVMLIHCLCGNTFVPITGNVPTYPGLYLLGKDEFLIHTYDFRTWEVLPFTAKVVTRETDGRSSYQFSKLILR